MKNALFVLVCSISIMLLPACNKSEKLSTASAAQQSSASLKTITQTMTPGQMHNQILSAYMQQYGIVEDNEITMAEVQTLCGRMAQIASDQGLLTSGMTVTQLAGDMYNDYVSSGAFVNGVLKSKDELITIATNSVPNLNIRNALNQIHGMVGQGNPNFIQDAGQLLDNLNSLNPQEQQMVSAFKSILQSSYDLWTDPVTPKPSYLPTGALYYQVIAMADAAGCIRGYYTNWEPGTTGAIIAEERGAAGAASASAAAAGKP